MTAVVEALAKMAVTMVEMAAAMMVRSKSHGLPDTTIQEKAAGEGRGGGWVGTAVTMTAKAVTPVMVVAVAGRSRTGGSGVKRHGRQRLGRPTAALGPETIWRESEREVVPIQHALRLHFLPSPLWATFLRQDAGNVGLCPSLLAQARSCLLPLCWLCCGCWHHWITRCRLTAADLNSFLQIGRASCRERV